MANELVIYTDESDRNGEYCSNFSGEAGGPVTAIQPYDRQASAATAHVDGRD